MSRCTHCGRQPSRRARFCDHCGGLVASSASVPVGPRRPRRRPAARPGPSTTHSIGAVLGGLVVVGGIVALSVAGAVDVGERPATSTTAGDVLLDDAGEVPAVGPGDGRVEPPREPPCVTPSGGTCALPFDADHDPVVTGRIDGGDVLLLDADRRLQRVSLPDGDAATPQGVLRVRWERTLEDVAPIEPDAGTDAIQIPFPVLTVDDRLALVADGRGVTALAIDDGSVHWQVDLPGEPTGPSYRAWRVGAHVMAANRFHLAAIDAERGELDWSIERPGGDVQPMEGGVAVIAPDVVHGFVPTTHEPAWRMRRASPNRGAFGVIDRPAGPVVVDGRASVTLDPDDGRVLIEHGTASVVTRAGDRTVVAAEWDAVTGSPALVGYGPEGTRRWRTDGPDVRCCELLLRPTQDGQVLAATIGRGRSEVGWLIDPADGRITATVRRPAITSALPIAVGEDTSVWLDGDALVGAAFDTGEVRWRAAAGTVLLSESPLLLRTTDGLVRP
jgi:outer membrane protein assembly factor BamB